MFFFVAGLMAMAMRAQLAVPGNTLVGPHAYDQLFTLHGTAMIFLFVAPFALGLANYLIPLQIGAPDMAFPRLNAFTYWLFLLGGLTVLSGAAVNGGAAATGWTAFAPLSDIVVGSGLGQDLWLAGLFMTSISAILTAVNFITTVFIYRAPAMTMWRIPIFTWEMIATSLLILIAFPPLATDLLDAVLRSDVRRAFLRSGRRRQPGPLPASVLVFRPPGSLHHDLAVLRRRQRDRRGLFAQADFRVRRTGPIRVRDRRAFDGRLGASHVHDRRGHQRRSSQPSRS